MTSPSDYPHVRECDICGTGYGGHAEADAVSRLIEHKRTEHGSPAAAEHGIDLGDEQPSPNPLDFLDGIEPLREALRGMVAALIGDGFTDEQARRLTTHMFTQAAS